MFKRLYTQLVGSGFGLVFARVAAGSALVQAAGMGLALVVGMLLARALGAHGLGIYSLAMSVAALLCVAVEFGLPTYLIREVAAAHVRGDWVRLQTVVSWCTRTIVIFSFAVAALVGLTLMLSAPALGRDLTSAIVAALPLLLFVALTRAHEATLQGMNLQPLAQIPMLIGRPGVFLVALSATAFAFGAAIGAEHVVLLHSISMVFVAGAIAVLFRMQIAGRTPTTLSTFDGRHALRQAFPMAVTEGLRVSNGHLAFLLLGFLSTPTAIGVFKVADAVCILCALPVFVLNNVAGPQIARLNASGDAARLKSLVSYVALAMTVGCLTIAAPLVFFSSTILSVLFGSGFDDARVPVIILCAGYALSAMLGPSFAFMNLTGRERTVTLGFAASFGASLLVGVAAISVAGATGAALANVTGYCVWSGWLWREAKRQADVDTSLVPTLRTLFGRT